MKRTYKLPSFRKILVPVTPSCDSRSVMTLARAISQGGKIVLIGLIGIPEGESLSMAAPAAQKVRSVLHKFSNEEAVHTHDGVHVSHTPWTELRAVIEAEEPDLLILDWGMFNDVTQPPDVILSEQSCDIAVLRGPLPESANRILVPMRGSSYAEQALRISLALSETTKAKITSLHLKSSQVLAKVEPSFRGLEKVLANLPDVEQVVLETDDFTGAILDQSARFDLLIMGTSVSSPNTSFVGPIASRVIAESKAAVVAVRARRRVQSDLQSARSGQSAISVLVDKWFAENTYAADEFADRDFLLSLKKKQGLTVSLALPALNEEQTVGKVIEVVKNALMDSVPLLDEIVLMDSNSTDRTREIGQGLGIPVHIHQETLPHYGSRSGKGEALWKSLYVTRGDIVLWIDTDIVNIHPRFVYGLLGPLLLRERTQFVKGFYRRPLKVGSKVQAGGGGRVTELTARPMINLFYPELSGIIQPLSGEYGGRRSALECLPFSSGYGVEIGLLIDIFEHYGLNSIAQVDLLNRVHHNQPLEALSKMSFAIIQTVARKLEDRYGWEMLDEVNKSMKLVQYEQGRFSLFVEEIAELERPPMVELLEYREKVVS